MTKKGDILMTRKDTEQVLRLYYWVMTPSRIRIFGRRNRDSGQKIISIHRSFSFLD